jgi:hypothetical protein
MLAISLLLPLANSSASAVSENEWHIQISIPRHTYYVGETINLTGTVSPPLSATLLLTFILPDGSFNTFYVNSDVSGNFSFGRQFGTGSYSIFANIFSPQPNGSVTSDLVNFIIISKVQQPPDSTTSTSQTSPAPSITGTTNSTSDGGNGSSQPSNTAWSLNQTIEAAAAITIVSAALLAVKLRRRA